MSIISWALVLICACDKPETLDAVLPGIIEDRVFNATVLIDGHKYDGTILRNCIFENISGDGLQIRNVNDLCIEDCVFRNIKEDAIRFRNSGTSSGVKILNNEIYNIENNGILASEGHENVVIKGNIIHDVATNNVSSQFGSPHHGIYFQGYNVTIAENTIYNILNDQGNCISIRTYGKIERNKLYGAKDHGISYFSDHPGNALELLIENNVIFDNGKRGINLASNGNASNHIGSALIRFNTIVSHAQSPIGINNELKHVPVDILGNILIRTDGREVFVFSNLSYNQSNNLRSSGDLGFIDFERRDLRIDQTSKAVNAAVGLFDFPETDFSGNLRSANTLDSGAFEY